jgi:hypothetical protein
MQPKHNWIFKAMENTNSQETKRPERIFGLNEKFKLFDQEFTSGHEIPDAPDEFTLSVTFSLHGIDTPLTIRASKGGLFVPYGHIAPFDKSAGYQIDDQDFTPEARREKLKQWMAKYPNPQNPPSSSPLQLYIWGKFVSPTKEMIRPLERARLMLSFPSELAMLEAELVTHNRDYSDLPNGGFSVPISPSFFYPADLGPMSSIYSMPYIGEGLNLFLPSDSDKLGQIVGEFVLLDDRDEGGEQ